MSANEQAELPIEDYLCLALYTASRAVTGLYRELLDDFQLTYPQYLVMRLLWQRGPCLVKDIAATLRLDYGTLSPLLKRLESAGLVRRTRRPDDERAVEVSLTPDGEAMRTGAARVPGELAAALGLDEAQATELLATLRTLTASAEQAAAG